MVSNFYNCVTCTCTWPCELTCTSTYVSASRVDFNSLKIIGNRHFLPYTVIPLEISRRGEAAIEIYKLVLKKGKMKIPRCNLLILGEERVGKTSLYRLLVRKGFNREQEPTRGIDDNEVDIVDVRAIAMGDGDGWEEKPKENQEEQLNKTYIDGMSETLHAELPPEKVKPEYKPEPVCQEDVLIRMLESIRKELESVHREPTQSFVRGKLSHSQVVYDEHNTTDHVASQRLKQQPTSANKATQDKHHTQLYRSQSSDHKEEPRHKPKASDVTPKAGYGIENSPSQSVSSESEEINVSSTEATSEEPKQEVTVPYISRQESQSISKKLKAKKKSKDKAKEPIQLELRTLDFAGQKQYRPMHHCFITRRAMYLVVFNLQEMMKHIESPSSDSKTDGDGIPSSPIEQLRYWLYSIHAHIFPLKGDYTRQVCLVGTHKSGISDGEIHKVNERLTDEFEDDERCTNLFHFTKEKLIFAPVENSIDGKEHTDREDSGALSLQRELKLVSSKLKFLDEDHPLIWLRFEQELIKLRHNLVNNLLPLFVTVDEVLKIAQFQGIDDTDSQELALDFFHHTGKLVYLSKLATFILRTCAS